MTKTDAARLILKLPEGRRGHINPAGLIQEKCSAFLIGVFGGTATERKETLACLDAPDVVYR